MNAIRTNWQLWSGALSAEQCDEIIEICEKHPVQRATTFSSDNNPSRISKVRWVEDQMIGGMLWDYVQKANQVFGIDVEPYTDIQYTEYHGSEEGKYDNHHDIDWGTDKGRDRKISITVQLSDPADYQGGYFNFTECESPLISDITPRGSILVFPSYLVHSVSPVTKGLRRSLVSWFEGPKWR